MDNSINSLSSVSFNSRYLNIKNPEDMPRQIYDTIYKSDAVDKFLKAGKPKTFIDKILNLFRRDEILNIEYVTLNGENTAKEGKQKIQKENLNDPYKKICNLIFKFRNHGKEEQFVLSGSQEGIRRQAGSIPRPGEDYRYRPPQRTAEDKLLELVKNIDNIAEDLKRSINQSID